VYIVLVGGSLWLLETGDLGDFAIGPFNRNAFLRDVAEPITLIKGHHEWKSDQVWDAVTFTDGRHVERHAKYVVTS
jgi:hypothetical protein